METVNFKIENGIAKIELNRPDKSNALNEPAWKKLKQIFEDLDSNENVRVVIINGSGKNFCSGIDLSMLQEVFQSKENCEGRKREKLYNKIVDLQKVINQLELCRKPVIAAIQGACIGAGLDLISACDMRYATEDAFFSIKEVDMGMVADLGSLQRLPKIMNEGVVRELAFTGRNFYAGEAKTLGLLNNVFKDYNHLNVEVDKISETIAKKSPLAIKGIKENMNFSRNHSIDDGLKNVALWNSSMLISDDIKEIFLSKQQQRQPIFKD